MAKPTILPEWDETEINSVEPDATHKAEGWLAPGGIPEKPPYQSFNFWQNSVWKWLSEINIKGMLGYDNLTDYIADLSYVVGSDGNLYQCGINNGPASSIVNPVGDVTGTWNDIINTIPVAARGYIDGLILENDTDTDHDIKMNIGICRDKTDTLPIQLTAALIKQIDANWAEGTNQGGFPSGLTLLADTWYHFYIIMSADSTKVDAGFDTSLTAVNLFGDATDYSLYRRVGSVLTDGSSNIIGFFQYGDFFLWNDPPQDVSVINPGTNAVTETLSIPLGVRTIAHLNIMIDRGDSGGPSGLYLSCLDIDDEVAESVNPPLSQVWSMVDGYDQTSIAQIMSNLLSQIRSRIHDSGATTAMRLITTGWQDFRGKDA